ncbi:MAG: EamA/RhaT family transporter, partial [Alphaproteobacteria bacterium]
MFELWILATLAAALVQTLRFSLQKALQREGLSTGAVTFSRFVFAAPLALVLAALLLRVWGAPAPQMPPRFWAMAALGGLGQIVATLATVALFAMRNFAVGIAFTKSETVQVALFSALVLGEAVSPGGLVAILTGLGGVLALSLPRAGGWALSGRATALGLAAGALFGLSSVAYRAASLSLGDGAPLLRAGLTLAAVTSLQT